MLTVDGPHLDAEVVALAEAPNFAAVSTLLPDGQPQTQVVWVDTDGRHLLVNTPIGTQKHRNAERDPRATVMVWDRDNPFRYAEVRGRVVAIVTGPKAEEHIDRLAHRFTGGPYRGPNADRRAILKIVPHRQLISRPPGR